MQHSFDIGIATKYGVNEAIFLNNIAFWMAKNKANNKHFYDGTHWTYNSQNAFLALFPYWTRQNLRTIITNCISKDLIKTGNYNKNPYDKTYWYALTDLGLSLYPSLSIGWNQPVSNDGDCEAETPIKPAIIAIGWNQPIKVLESTNQGVGINQPIPDNKPALKTDVKQKSFCEKSKTQRKAENEEKHPFADSKDKNAREKKHIEENEKIKRSPMPDNLRELYKNGFRKCLS